MADGEKLEQDEIEKLLQQAPGTPVSKPEPEPPAAPPATGQATATFPATSPSMPAFPTQPPEERSTRSTVDDVQLLLTQAEDALASVTQPSAHGSHAQPFELTEFQGTAANSEQATLDLLRDVELDLRIELGRATLPLEDVLKLSRGAIVPLDKLAGDPVDIFVNRRLVARGEILVLNDNFCVRVAELLTGDHLE
ncbi:MAG: flagellar motor switch protein FliN [Pirellulaceae bacterium]|nr:flagellar motor switch protein FliN [Planctomycetaceae bacterium]HIM28518.1 flagellar motor switch protein FliN [Planctomycetota bacterium]